MDFGLDWLNYSAEVLRRKSLGGFNYLWKPFYHYGKRSGLTEFGELGGGQVEIDEEQNEENKKEKKRREDGETFEPLDRSPLSFLDEFQVVNGVPVFLLGPDATSKQNDSGDNNPDLIDPNPDNPAAESLDAENLDAGNSSDDSDWIVSACRLSADGTRLVSGHNDGTVRLWDAEHGKLLWEKIKLHRSAVADVEFRGSSCSVVLSCDWLGTYCIWDSGAVDVNKGDKECVKIDCAQNWANLGHAEVIRPGFMLKGTYLMFPVKAYNFTRMKIGGFIEAMSVSDPLMGRDGTSDLQQECYVFIFNTMDDETAGVPSSQASIPVEDEFTIATRRLAPGGDALLMGFTDIDLTDGFVVLWPECQTQPHRSVKIEGTVGAWSPKKDLIVSWTVPSDVLPEETAGGACFVWDVNELARNAADNRTDPLEMSSFRRRMGDECTPIPPKVLRDASGVNVLWCSFVNNVDGELRLVACYIGRTVRIVFWDIETEVPTHVLVTDIPGVEMSLGEREAWAEKWVQGNSVRGLQPIMLTRDKTWLAVVGGNKAIIWNAEHATEVLNMSIPTDILHKLGNGTDIVLGSMPGKFAIMGQKHILLATPRPPGKAENGGVLVANLKYADNRIDFSHEAVGKFTLDGNKFGLVHPSSHVMHVWDFGLGERFTMFIEGSNNRKAFVYFAFSADGNTVVTCMRDRQILLWSLRGSRGAVLEGCVESIRGSSIYPMPCKALAIHRDAQQRMTVVACEHSGALVWFTVQQQEGMSSSGELKELPSGGGSWVKIRGLFESHDSLKSVRVTPSLLKRPIGVESDRRDAVGAYSCNFSPDGTRGVLMQDPQKVTVWDLVQRQPLQDASYFYPVGIGPKALFPFPHNISDCGQYAIVGRQDDGPAFVRCTPSTTVDMLKGQVGDIPKHAQLCGNGRWLLVDEFEDAALPFDSAESQNIPNSFKGTKQVEELDTLMIFDVFGKANPLEVSGKKLMPSKLMVMSPCGRRVACLTSNFTIQVWTTYAASGLIPDYHRLKVQGKQKDRQYIKLLLDELGASVLNYKGPSGLSILYHAVLDENVQLLRWCFKWSIKQKVKVQVRSVDRINGQEVSALELALKMKSPGSAREIMQFAMVGVAHESDLAKMFQQALVQLGKTYPKIFHDALGSERMMVNIGSVAAPDRAFRTRDFFVTTDSRMRPQSDAIKELWEDQLVQYTGHQADTVWVPCHVKVIPYPNAAQLGNDGALRPLIMSRASHHGYSALALQVIIEYKWQTYGRRAILDEVWHYMFMIGFFTLYGVFLASNSRGTGVCLSFSIAFAAMNLLRELKQMLVYSRDRGWKGFVFWVTSGWNWVELASYVLLVFVIPFAHFSEWITGEDRLSSLVAIESILLWWKMLYYARAFKQTGPLVIMISEIIADITFFLVLAVMVLVGFGVAFYVLFRSIEKKKAELEEGLLGDIEQAFGSVWKSLVTMFAYMLGDFDLTVLYNSPVPEMAITLFIVFMMAMMVILLNLLIAIMGDSFDRIKNTEDMQFLKARASAIDDVESMMSEKRKEELQAEIQPFLHVLIPKYQRSDMDGDQWQGRVLDLQNRFRKEMKLAMKASMLLTKKVKDEVRGLKERVRALEETSMNVLQKVQGENPAESVLAVDAFSHETVQGLDVLSMSSSSGLSLHDGSSTSTGASTLVREAVQTLTDSDDEGHAF